MSQANLQAKLSTARELVSFFWRSKTWWLTPIVVVIVVVGVILVLAESSMLAPFIYALF